jgi:hypothetical protein
MTGWVRRLLAGRQLERQLDAELRDHVERQVADYLRTGMRETEARRQALITGWHRAGEGAVSRRARHDMAGAHRA